MLGQHARQGLTFSGFRFGPSRLYGAGRQNVSNFFQSCKMPSSGWLNSIGSMRLWSFWLSLQDVSNTDVEFLRRESCQLGVRHVGVARVLPHDCVSLARQVDGVFLRL